MVCKECPRVAKVRHCPVFQEAGQWSKNTSTCISNTALSVTPHMGYAGLKDVSQHGKFLRHCAAHVATCSVGMCGESEVSHPKGTEVASGQWTCRHGGTVSV